MFDYQQSGNTAISLLNNFGRVIQVITATDGEYDTETSKKTNTSISTDVVACDFSYRGNVYDGNMVQIGDRYALLSNTIVNVDVSAKLIIDGVTWSIVKVEKLAPAGVVVLWKVQIRK